jgi:hypothetical protein
LLHSSDRALVLTTINGHNKVFELDKQELEHLGSSDKEPPVDHLLALKDDLCIPDAKWGSVVETFHLSSKCSLYYIRKRRDQLDKYIPISLRIKFAFDGARITIKQKQMQVVGTVELLSNKTVREVKSATNAHQWIIYLGSETNEDLVCDMPLLEEMLGLYSVHHPKSTFRCTHCHVTKSQLHDFTIERWAFRTPEDLERLGSLRLLTFNRIKPCWLCL